MSISFADARVINAALARIEGQLERLEQQAEHQRALLHSLLAVLGRGQQLGCADESTTASAALHAQLVDYFGEGAALTVAEVLKAAARKDALADAIAQVIDMNRPLQSRAVALGLVLKRAPWAEAAGLAQGSRVYRLRAWGSDSPELLARPSDAASPS